MQSIGFVGLLAGALLLTHPAQAADDIPIGVIDPLTGGVAYDGQTDLNGVRLAVEEINAAGGVLGSQIKVLPEDGACNPGSQWPLPKS